MKDVTWVFISLPMRGLTDEQLYSDFRKATAEVKELLPGENVKVMETIIPPPKDLSRNVRESVWCLGRSIQKLARADYIYMADGSQNARGCKIELDCALMYGIPILNLKNSQGDEND